jgi:hypothetical protein
MKEKNKSFALNAGKKVEKCTKLASGMRTESV